MEPIKIEKILEKFIKSDKFVKAERKVTVFDKYREIVKDTFNNVTYPYKIINDILFIKVISSAYLNEVYFFKEEILKRLNLELCGIFIKDIKFTIGDEDELQCK